VKIDLIKGQAPDILLMNALSAHYSTEDMFDKLKIGDGSKAEVKLTVNGFEVPFDSIVQDIYHHCEQVHDSEVVQRALKLLSLAGLDELRDAMRKARDTVETALENAVRKLESGKQE
jgi:hypothetical protein